MQFLVYVFLYPLLWIISILPFSVFYFVSDCICFLTYRIIGYRKNTVKKNLAIALPHCSDKERKEIEKKFYRHLCDLFLEMIKTLTISDSEMKKRFVIKNIDMLKEAESKGKSIALLASHYASYEWSISLNKQIAFESYAIYKKITNSHFDRLVKKIRAKFGAQLITTKETIPTIEENYNTKKLSLYGFASDQSPKITRAFHWGTFFGLETPLQTGAEMLSKKYDMSMYFMHIRKVKRGFYEAEIELLSDHPKLIPDFEITELFMKKVEAQILEAPEYYLWTHKRWKHKRLVD